MSGTPKLPRSILLLRNFNLHTPLVTYFESEIKNFELLELQTGPGYDQRLPLFRLSIYERGMLSKSKDVGPTPNQTISRFLRRYPHSATLLSDLLCIGYLLRWRVKPSICVITGPRLPSLLLTMISAYSICYVADDYFRVARESNNVIQFPVNHRSNSTEEKFAGTGLKAKLLQWYPIIALQTVLQILSTEVWYLTKDIQFMWQRMKKAPISPSKTKIVPYGVTPEIDFAPTIREKWVVYLGAHWKGHCLVTLISAMSHVKRIIPESKLLLIGEGPAPYLKELKGLVTNLELGDNVEFMGKRSRREAYLLIRRCMVGAALYEGPLLPNDSQKFWEYISCGVPVLVTANVPSANEIEANGAGAVVMCEEEEVANALVTLLTDPIRWESCREGIDRLAEGRSSKTILRFALKNAQSYFEDKRTKS